MEKDSQSDKHAEPDVITPRILPHQAAAGRELSRARTRLLVCLWTLPVYMIAIWVLLNNRREIDAIMFIYMGVWAGFAIDMARCRCPICKQQFYVKNILMSLRARRCVHCGFDPHSVALPASEDQITL